MNIEPLTIGDTFFDMLFRAMRSYLTLAFIFASLALLQQTLAYEQDGEDYNYLVDFLDAASQANGNLPWRENKRALGTFWNLGKARAFNWNQALKDSEVGLWGGALLRADAY